MSRSRRVQRVHLALPVNARFGSTQVVLVDISVLGARIEHHVPLGTATGGNAHLAFRWEDEDISVDCRVVRSRLERFSVGADGLTIYHSGLEFMEPTVDTRATLKRIIGTFISRALHEIAKQTGYVCLQLENNRTWRKKRTHDPGQPAEGFTVSASEDQEQIQMLCNAYEQSDPAGRKMIQLFAQLSIMDGEGIQPGRYRP